MEMFSDESKLQTFMVCCVDFPVRSEAFSELNNRSWCTQSRSTGITIVSTMGIMEVSVVSLCSGVETMIGYEIVTLTLDHPRLTVCWVFFSVKQSTDHYLVRLPCVLSFIHKLSEIVLRSDLFMLLYEPGKWLKLVDVPVIFLLHVPWEQSDVFISQKQFMKSIWNSFLVLSDFIFTVSAPKG